MDLKDAYSIVCDATAWRRHKEKVDMEGEAYQIVLDAVRKQIENTNVMVGAPEPEMIKELDSKVKPEFRKHLENENWNKKEKK